MLHAVPPVLHNGRCAFLVTILLVTRCAALAGAARLASGKDTQRSSADVYYVTEVADRFTSFAARRSPLVSAFHAREQNRIIEAIEGAGSSQEKSLLEIAAVANEESRLDAQEATGVMLNFVTSLKQAMGAEGSVASCQYLTCGANAFCTEEAKAGSARCHCNDGYAGNGFVCRPPTELMGRPLIDVPSGTDHPKIADMHITPISGNRLAIVYRDVAAKHQGYLLIGQAEHNGIKLGAPVAFSNGSQAFGPMVTELQDGSGLAITFRNMNRNGTGFIVGAALDNSSAQVRFSDMKPFAHHQAQNVALVPLPGSLIAVLFAEHTTGAKDSGAMFGSAVMARVHADGARPNVSLAGKHRFVSGPVARISAAMLTPTSFVVAFRHRSSDGASSEHREASCLVAEARSTELAFTRQPLLLEPKQDQIWARSVAAVQPNVFAYTYHSGAEKVTKQAFLQVDPETRQMRLLKQPEVLGRGFTPFVGMVGTLTALKPQQDATQVQLLQQQGPRLLTYFTEGAVPKANMCVMGATGLPSLCKDVAWPDKDVVSVTGTQLGDGRAVIVFTDVMGAPFYQLAGLMGPAVGA
mmetsp:Transcript_39211/g.101445  ORF Transcript_39211/g.101445 Transcript_39211/m.101445 type:complete len:581 (+) Transcript_39211:49-1791(+)